MLLNPAIAFMHCKPKNSSFRRSAVADLHTNTCNRTDIQQKLLLNFPQTEIITNGITSFYEYLGFAITLNYHPAGGVVIKV
jgi:hypothetical protein